MSLNTFFSKDLVYGYNSMFMEKILFFGVGSYVSRLISFGIHNGFYSLLSFTNVASFRIYCSRFSYSTLESKEGSMLLLSSIPSMNLEFLEPALESGLP